jgi:hypothetical protein
MHPQRARRSVRRKLSGPEILQQKSLSQEGFGQEFFAIRFLYFAVPSETHREAGAARMTNDA